MFHLTLQSSNIKTGPIPVSTSSKQTCPNSCHFKNNGCYAEFGPLNIHWNKITNNQRGNNWLEFLDKIKELPSNQLWRHNQAGDLIGKKINNEAICEKSLKQLVKANKGKKGFLYTHKWKVEDNFRIIKYANDNGLTINISVNNLVEADYLVGKNSGPVVVVLDKDIKDNFQTKNGNKVVVCPAVIKDNINCSKCKLCSIPNRSFIIGFPAHGILKNKISEKLS